MGGCGLCLAFGVLSCAVRCRICVLLGGSPYSSSDAVVGLLRRWARWMRCDGGAVSSMGCGGCHAKAEKVGANRRESRGGAGKKSVSGFKSFRRGIYIIPTIYISRRFLR